MKTYVYSIPYPVDLPKEDFAGLFQSVDVEGVEEKEDTVEVYLQDEQIAEGEAFIAEICAAYGINYSKSELENKNWNEQWERSFQPILMDDFVYIRATFHPAKEDVPYEIVIDPKMSFGTGHHPTTAQMIHNMRLLDFSGKTVLDCGSGTGILAILAEKLGAAKIIALDNDAWCYENGLENASLNDCRNIEALIGDLRTVTGQTFDIILANIHRNFHIEHLSEMAAMLHPGGYLLASGFYSEDTPVVLDKALEQDLIATYRSTRNNWDCVIFIKK